METVPSHPRQMASWQETAARVQQYRDSSLRVEPPLSGIPGELPQNVTEIPRKVLSPEEFDITERSLEELLKLLASGELSSVTVTKAFLRRAALAQKLVSLSLHL